MPFRLRLLTISSLLLLASLTACTTIPTPTPIPSLPTSIITCDYKPLQFNTNQDLIYNLYELKRDFDECKFKHNTLVRYYNNLEDTK